MHAAAEAFVGAADDEQDFLVLAFEGFGLGFVEDGLGGLAVGAGLGHGALGFGEFGRGDDFHGFGDFLDVFDGFEAAFDFAEGGIVGGLEGGDGRGRWAGEIEVVLARRVSGLLAVCRGCLRV